MKILYAKTVSMLFRTQLEGLTDDIELATTIVDGNVTPLTSIFTTSKELIHEVGKREATLLEDASLSILTEYDIFGGQNRS